MSQPLCLTCSKPFEIIKIRTGSKQKRFCSDHCNDTWWNEQPLHPVIPRVDAHHPRALRALIKGGALGFKAFMAPSGIDDFPHVSPADIRAALPTLSALGVPLLVHAEMVDSEDDVARAGADPRQHATWLASRPPRFERQAAEALVTARDDFPGPHPVGFGIHVVHVADEGALGVVTAARDRGLPLSIETCPHYLTFAAEDVPDGDTRFKCAPPLRGAATRAALLDALAAGEFDSLASDHSPAPPALKALESGDFLAAWGGISGLQYALPATWDAMKAKGMPPGKLHALWSRFPAALAGVSLRKGVIAHGFDADIVVWAPDQPADTSPAALQHRHKVTPYADRVMQGRVLATFVRGSQVFDAALGVAPGACGTAVLGRKAPQAPK